MTQKIDFLFYSSDFALTNCLNEIESQHAVKVLRRKIGDNIEITDGLGNLYFGVISEANQKKCKVEVKQVIHEFEKPTRQIHIAVCPTKNMDRIEYFVEKCVEIGISSFYFVLSQNTYAKKENLARMQKIAISAMKQSLKAYLPVLHEVQKIDKFFEMVSSLPNKYIAHLDNDFKDLSSMTIPDECLIFIGPEGDFADSEIQKAKEAGFLPVKMGESRLRTETAGVVAATILNIMK